MELVMLFITITALILMGVVSLNLKDKDPLTNTKGMFIAGFFLAMLDSWCYCVYYGIYFN